MLAIWSGSVKALKSQKEIPRETKNATTMDAIRAGLLSFLKKTTVPPKMGSVAAGAKRMHQLVWVKVSENRLLINILAEKIKMSSRKFIVNIIIPLRKYSLRSMRR